MSATTLKKLVIPTAGDDLLGSWQRFADSAGVITTADSVAAARVLLSKMETAGVLVSTVSPAYFDIGGIVYRADGRKNDRRWVLSPVNEIEFSETTYSGNWVGQHLNAGQASGMMQLILPVRPYDRLVSIDANIYGKAESGNVDMAISFGQRAKLSRIASGEAHSVSGTLQAVLRAGEQGIAGVSIRGGSGGGRATLATDNRFNTLAVTAFPITMN